MIEPVIVDRFDFDTTNASIKGGKVYFNNVRVNDAFYGVGILEGNHLRCWRDSDDTEPCAEFIIK